MLTQAKLSAQAAALRAINTAKHKAAGLTHRVEFSVCRPNGKYQRTAVVYVLGEPTPEKIIQLAIKQGSKSLSASLSSALVSEL
jgi:hypothetical protein